MKESRDNTHDEKLKNEYYNFNNNTIISFLIHHKISLILAFLVAGMIHFHPIEIKDKYSSYTKKIEVLKEKNNKLNSKKDINELKEKLVALKDNNKKLYKEKLKKEKELDKLKK